MRLYYFVLSLYDIIVYLSRGGKCCITVIVPQQILVLFKIYNIFAEQLSVPFFQLRVMRNNRMEYEANLFASQVSLPDDAFLELVERGFSAHQIVQTLNSDINLVALKADILISQGHPLCPQEHRNNFLRYDK